MKLSLRFASQLLVASTTAVLLSGCYTQLATREDDEERYERNGAARVVDEQDSTADRTPYYYDDYDNWRGHYRLGFSYYYPSWWYWDAAFSDPFYYGWPGYGYPGWYADGFGWNHYYGLGNYYGYGPYGGSYGYYPYGYYNGYPYVVAANNNYQQQTRNSGYRRTGDGRVGGFTGRSASSLGVTPASRRAGYQAPASSTTSTRRSESPSARGSSRVSTPQSSGSSGGSSAPSRSNSSGTRSAPSSGGSRSPEGGTRSSGSTRNRGGSDAPMSGYYRSYMGTQGSGTNAVAPASSYYRPNAGSSSYAPSSGYTRSDGGSRSSTPSYNPPASSSAPSYSAPASSSGSSGGGNGGSRSSGASRSGRN